MQLLWQKANVKPGFFTITGTQKLYLTGFYLLPKFCIAKMHPGYFQKEETTENDPFIKIQFQKPNLTCISLKKVVNSIY